MRSILLHLNIICLITLGMSSWAETSPQISGKVTLKKGLEKSMSPGGTLFIFAKKAGDAAGNGAPPIAVLRIPQPQFPVSFTLTAQNTMIPNGPFEGPFTVYARYSPSGDAMDKSGPQGTDKKKPSVSLGESNLSIELKDK